MPTSYKKERRIIWIVFAFCMSLLVFLVATQTFVATPAYETEAILIPQEEVDGIAYGDSIVVEMLSYRAEAAPEPSTGSRITPAELMAYLSAIGAFLSSLSGGFMYLMAYRKDRRIQELHNLEAERMRIELEKLRQT